MQVQDFGFGTQIRKSPYFDATVRWGAQGLSVYNHMCMRRDFGDAEANFWNLGTDAILCDVAVECQVEVTGPDGGAFVPMRTPRNLSNMAVGQCKYVLMTNASGGILNDPILLRLGENHFWFSLADSDILLWAQGVAVHSGMDVTITEPDVSPLQLQGPKSGEIMKALFGDEIADLRYYWFREMELDGIPLIVSRTGWSSELGYEIYLRNSEYGDALWERIMATVFPQLHARQTKFSPIYPRNMAMAAFDTSRPTYAASSKGFGAFATSLIAVFSAWNDSRQTRNALSQLSDHELEDIGLTRGDINSF